ncbi:hypothetical protein ACWD3J_38770 [Streptomyces sp. NPDC002755]|uniref:hypothetical protein n=1 Tax=Streptomyces sp. NPDC002884 TaxID=3154544 RepID=UPI00331BC68A
MLARAAVKSWPGPVRRYLGKCLRPGVAGTPRANHRGIPYRLVDISGYGSDGQDRYAAIWEKASGPAWQARHGLTTEAYQRAFDELGGQGYRLVDISGYGSDGQDRYAAIWEQMPGGLWEARTGIPADAFQRVFDQLS